MHAWCIVHYRWTESHNTTLTDRYMIMVYTCIEYDAWNTYQHMHVLKFQSTSRCAYEPTNL